MDINKITIDKTKESVKLELAHLNDVLNTLKEGLFGLLGYRKKLMDDLIEYRKEQIEDCKFDEDKPLDYIDLENLAVEEAYKAALRKIKELEELIENPYFGKINFKEKSFPEEEIYIGKYGYIDDKKYEPLVIDWRAPIASLFYHGGLGKASYVTPNGKVEANINNRRQFIIKNSQLHGMFDTETEVRDEILQLVLSSSSSEKLKDIIMTIQKEQDEIIRYKKMGAVVVNGIAGSGKTTVALHRIAYLIYNYRKELENKVLILGPNNIFMEYISSVLPTLGETSVRYNTFWDFILEAIGEKVDIISHEDFIEAINSGDGELKEDASLKRSLKYLKTLDAYVDKLIVTLYPPKDLRFLGKILMTKEEMKKALEEDFIKFPLKSRALRLKRIIISRMKEVRNEKLKEIDKEFIEAGDNIAKGEMTQDSLTRREKIIDLIKRVIEFRSEITYLGQGSIVKLYMMQNTMRILTREDLIPILYLKDKLEGVKLPFNVRYLVVDEAQDLSLSAIKVLSSLTQCRDMTLVGDINQRLISYEGEENFINLEEIIDDVSKFNLYNSYRSTDEIIKYSHKFLEEDKSKSLRQGDPVREIKLNDIGTLKDKIKEEYILMKEKGLENIAIITRDQDFAYEIHGLIKDDIYHKYIKDEDGVYNTGTLLLSAYLAKGLEFDGVIAVDRDTEFNKPDLIKYIISTRALHMLSVINII